ncbi:calcium-binding protein [Gemmobacter nectariphilus]|uniref:calcium-binding protein n=1 Tax=Gemmobacter nectariphilus TaxID=220343 RepID=UPI0003F53803|nr:calcium-binding protein [Gemmobacter nectariphilus]
MPTVYGTDQDDVLDYGNPPWGWTIYGGAGNDLLNTGGNNDALYGGEGNDSLFGGTQTNIIDGGAGIDTFYINGDPTDTTSWIEANIWDLSISGPQHDPYYYPPTGRVNTFVSIENVFIVNGANNVIKGSNVDNLLSFWDGNDTGYGRAGNDTLLGFSGADSLYGGDGNDMLEGGDGDDHLSSGAGSDTLDGGSGIDTAIWDIPLAAINVYKSASNLWLESEEGTTVVLDIEYFQFSDQTLTLTQIVDIARDITGGPTGTVLISGTALEDSSLTADTSNISDADGLGDFSYQWIANGVEIVDATNETFTPGQAQVGKTLTVRVSYIDGAGNSESLTSAATSVVQNVNDAPTGQLKFTGEFTVGSTVYVDRSEIQDEDGFGSFVGYHWYRDGVYRSGGGDGTSNPLMNMYEIMPEYLGEMIHLIYSFRDSFGNIEKVQSQAFLVTLGSIKGGSGNDSLTGTIGDDSIYGLGGHDTLLGRVGDDLLYGGDGNDELWGSVGNDTLLGEAGNDRIGGSDGDDLLEGGSGDDEIWGGSDSDTVKGGDGHDTLHGGTGNDVVVGGLGDDLLYGGADDDLVVGGSGDDTLRGENGRDTLRGGGGNDDLSGGIGDDVLRGGDGADILIGGDGEDILDGQVGDDILEGQAGNDRLLGGLGDDLLRGGDGNDVLRGQLGTDTLFGGNGADLFVFRYGAEASGPAGRDVIADFEVGIDKIHFGTIPSNLTFIGGSAFQKMAGEVRYDRSMALVQADLDGDGAADFSIEIMGAPSLTASDFVL